MGPLIDLSGKTFGRLVVLKRVKNSAEGYSRWVCQCECGRKVTVHGLNLQHGHTKSCGHHKPKGVNLKHGCAASTNGKRETTEYKSWKAMIRRCTKPKDKDYINYGGRGIQICKRWRYSFENFLSDMGKKHFKTTLDRKRVNENYTPSNCRWATAKQQANNRRKRVRLEQYSIKEIIKDLKKRGANISVGPASQFV